MHIAVLVVVGLSLGGQVPLVAPSQPAPVPARKPPPPTTSKPAADAPEAPSSPPGTPPAPPPVQGPANAVPPPAQPAPTAPAPVGTGIPLIDKILQSLPQEPAPQTGPAWPTLEPGQVRPVIGMRFDYEDFLNATYFKDETLKNFVRHPLGLPLNRKMVDEDAAYIAQQYRLRGFIHAHVAWKPEETPQGDVLVFSITAGSRGQLKSVEVQGNKGVSDEALLVGMFHRPFSLLGIFTSLTNPGADRGGVYHAGYIDQDTRAILKNYEDHGYREAKVTGTRALAADAEGKDIRLVFDVQDGPLHHFGVVKVVGDLPASQKEVQRVLGKQHGDPADLLQLREGMERVLDLWRSTGHANAKAELDQRLRKSDREMDVVIRIEAGPITRVGTIRIVGDPTTSQRVIKRDLALREGQPFSLPAARKSEQRLLYTGLFSKVTVKSVATPDPNVVDVDVEVSEIQSWFFSLAPAFIPGEGLVGLGFVGFRNLFGQAWVLNAGGVLSQRRQTGSVDLADPRVLDTRLSVGGNARWNRQVYPEFSLLRRGAALTLGYPIIERSMLALSYNLELQNMEASGTLAGYIGTPRFPDMKRRGAVSFTASYDLRDTVMFPSRGMLLSASMENGSPLWLGEMNFLTLSANARFYIPLPFSFVLKTNTTAAIVFNPTGAPVPASERFYEGGPQSVRGYGWQSITPTVPLGDPADPAGPRLNARIGGTSRFVNNLELQSPQIPVTPLTPVVVFIFLDAGNTWSEFERPFFVPNTFSAMRDGTALPLGMFYSVGVGGMLATALLPIRLEFSVPLTRRVQDDPLNFFFNLGSPF